MNGISVIVCCYNSSDKITPTLQHLILQKCRIKYEVILVDNSSRDDTVDVAKSIIRNEGSNLDFKIIEEKVQGLSYARLSGIKASKYEYIVFCDDDNWLSEQYLQKAHDIFQHDDRIGIAFGTSTSVYEVLPPNWFYDFEQALAVGMEGQKTGRIEPPLVPWGAGMILRKAIFNKVIGAEATSILSDRKGKNLSSGGDTEICYQFRKAGYDWWYDTDLNLHHFISKERIEWKYLKNLFLGFGKAEYQIERHYGSKKLNATAYQIMKIIIVHFFQKMVTSDRKVILQHQRKIGYYLSAINSKNEN